VPSRCRSSRSERRRPLLPLVALALGAVLVTACSERSDEAQGKGGDAQQQPDVLVITVDTLRPDHLGSYGHTYAETPTIDALAGESIVFHQAYTTIPRTTPGIASLMTGLWPHRHGSREVHDPIRELPTLASVLRRAGYATVGVTGNGAAGEKQRLGSPRRTRFTRRSSPTWRPFRRTGRSSSGSTTTSPTSIIVRHPAGRDTTGGRSA
jgi:arylsulfatase A-like enzyme